MAKKKPFILYLYTIYIDHLNILDLNRPSIDGNQHKNERSSYEETKNRSMSQHECES